MLLPSQRNRLCWTILLLLLVGCITTKYPLSGRSPRSIASDRRKEIALLLTRNSSSTGTSSDLANGQYDEIALTKAFGLPEFKSKVFPFFYRHEGNYGEDELTMTVFITPNRFDRLRDLVVGYEGPVSAVLHISPSSRTIPTTLSSLQALYLSDPVISQRLDIHLVSSLFDRQLNAWRNYARAYARTGWVMMLDIDLALRTDLRGALGDVLRGAQGEGEEVAEGEEAGQELEEREKREEVEWEMRRGMGALVVPVFEYSDPANEPEDYNDFPADKKELTEKWEDGSIMYFYQIISACGQAPTDHARYFRPSNSSSSSSLDSLQDPPPTYPVEEWKLGYEPYLIFRRDGPPWCDERFIGFGHNKEACTGEMLLSGMRFHVLKEHFLVHRKHVKDGAENKNNELQRNNKMWESWEKDQCMRYIDLLAMRGTLHTAQKSLIDTCKKHGDLKVSNYIEMSKRNALDLEAQERLSV